MSQDPAVGTAGPSPLAARGKPSALAVHKAEMAHGCFGTALIPTISTLLDALPFDPGAKRRAAGSGVRRMAKSRHVFRPCALCARLGQPMRAVIADLGDAILPMRASLKRALWALVVSLAGLAVGHSALAEDASTSAFDAADANRDGLIDPEEWARFSSGLFDRIDRDGDGKASAAELDEAFETFDYNRDGVIEGHEAPLVIILGDADDDGRVSRDEFDAIDWRQDPIDTDGDGYVSRREFTKARREIHDQADFDRSTTLGRSEYDAAPSLTLFRF